MFKIQVVAVGKLHYKELYETSERFINMSSRFAEVKVLEVRESKSIYPKNLQEEEERIMKLISLESTILCDVEGQKLTSEEFSNFVKRFLDSGQNISFVIGGHQGVSQNLKSRVKYKISFSDMTFGHNIFRIMLLEQIYRALCIINNVSYHK